MKQNHISTCATLFAASFLALTGTPANAFSFTTNFTPDSNGAKGNILLDSITLSDSSVIDDFAFVDSADILQNDAFVGGNTGAASSERGDLALGVAVEDPAAADVVASLGNINLNNIIDTEDLGSFKVNLFFDGLADQLFFWERGKNSSLGVQAIDASGNLLGNLRQIDSSLFEDAGFQIDTTEISGAQTVSSQGFDLAFFGVSSPIAGIQVTSTSTDNGPDFKVIGAAADVPEPATLAGLGLIAGTIAASRRKSKVS